MRFSPAVSDGSAVELSRQMESAVLMPFGFASESAAGLSTGLLVGAGPILNMKHEIDELRRRCDQSDDITTDIDYFLSYKDPRNGRPVVMTFRTDGRLAAAVFFHQVCFAWVGSGLLCGGDSAGDGVLIAPADEREMFLRRAIEDLLVVKKMFHTVRLRVKTAKGARVADFGDPRICSKLSERTVRHQLVLADTYADMLASFGLRTRRSLRTKRRHLEERLRPDLFTDMTAEQAFEVMCYLRGQSSMPARSMWYFEGRRRILQTHPDAFAMALRSHDGAWLSILSGWRRHGCTYVDVQLNHRNFARESLSAVMRAFLLEYEISIGQKSLVFVGGCSALLERYCHPNDTLAELVVSRDGLRQACFRKVIGMFCDPGFEKWIYF